MPEQRDSAAIVFVLDAGSQVLAAQLYHARSEAGKSDRIKLPTSFRSGNCGGKDAILLEKEEVGEP